MKRYFLLCGFCIALVINACKHEPVDISQQATPTTTSTTTGIVPENDSVCFNTQIQPLFNSSCAMSGCHDAVTHAEGYNFTTYNGIMVEIEAGRPTHGKIMKEINDLSMPQKPVPLLTEAQKSLLVKWISEGAQNKICTDGCDPGNATFTAGVNPILKVHCVGCHNSNFSSGGVKLNGYANIQTSVQNGKLLCAIQHGAGCSPMPQNAPKLKQSCIDLIQNWITNGAPND
jgi:uncharacterized membrane protein